MQHQETRVIVDGVRYRSIPGHGCDGCVAQCTNTTPEEERIKRRLLCVHLPCFPLTREDGLSVVYVVDSGVPLHEDEGG